MADHLKPWLSIDSQLQLLRDRGMKFPDREQAKHALTAVGYYRLSGYWQPYRRPSSNQSAQLLDDLSSPGTHFAEVLALYNFDRSLKNLLWSGIEPVEVAFRSRIGHVLGKSGPLAHTDPGCFRPSFDHTKWWKTAKRRISRARGRDATVDHHDQNYAGDLPLWVLTDLLDFSDVSKLYAGMHSQDQRVVADWFGVSLAVGASKSSRKQWKQTPSVGELAGKSHYRTQYLRAPRSTMEPAARAPWRSSTCPPPTRIREHGSHTQRQSSRRMADRTRVRYCLRHYSTSESHRAGQRLAI